MNQMCFDKMVQNAEKPVTSSFWQVSVTCFSLHLGHPNLDTYNVCVQLEVLIKESDDNDKTKSEVGRDLHSRTAESAHEQTQIDKKDSNPGCIILLSSRLYQHLNTDVVFYCRQLWTYNLGVRNTSMHFCAWCMIVKHWFLEQMKDYWKQERCCFCGMYQVTLYETRKGVTNDKIKWLPQLIHKQQ
jgi:hypothetical protein